MKLIFTSTLLILFCLSSYTLIAQQKETSHLSALIKTYASLDSNEEKDDTLLEVVDLVGYISKDSIETILQNYKTLFIAKYAQAEYHKQNKEYELAKNEFKILEHAVLEKEPVDYTLLAHTIWSSTNTFSGKNFSFKKGLEELYKGLDYAKQSQVDKMIMKYHSNLSFYNSSSANYEEAIFHNKMRYDLAKKINDSIAIIQSLKIIMEIFNATNNSESSLKIWRQVQPMYKKLGYRYPVPSQLLTSTTKAFLNTKQLDSAVYYNTECARLDSIQGYTFRNCYNTLNKGKILIGLDKIDEAEKAFLSSYELSKNTNNAFVQVTASTYLSQIYIKKEKNKEALDILKQNYPLSKKIRNVNQARLELLLSKAYEASKVLDSAIYYRNKSDLSFEQENLIVLEKQIALAKAELGINELLTENKNLASTKVALNERVEKTNKTKNALLYSFITLMVLIGFFIYHRNQKEKLRISSYKAELTSKERIAIEAELNTIRSQMNPHFMFNSLNSINEYIQNDSSEEASNYLVKFSRLMRSTLNYSKRKFVTLEEEIDLIKLYIELENLRFYNSIDFNLTIDNSIDIKKTRIPPMMIQPFIENAIWHGLMVKEEHRILTLSFSENEQNIICEIKDNGIGRAASAVLKTNKPKHKSQGIGLTQRRLELLKSIHGKEARVDVIDLMDNQKALGTLVKVVLPKHSEA